jgi:hypothetical protein
MTQRYHVVSLPDSPSALDHYYKATVRQICQTIRVGQDFTAKQSDQAKAAVKQK